MSSVTAKGWVDFWARINNRECAYFEHFFVKVKLWRDVRGNLHMYWFLELPKPFDDAAEMLVTEEDVLIWLQQFLVEDWRFDSE